MDRNDDDDKLVQSGGDPGGGTVHAGESAEPNRDDDEGRKPDETADNLPGDGDPEEHVRPGETGA